MSALPLVWLIIWGALAAQFLVQTIRRLPFVRNVVKACVKHV